MSQPTTAPYGTWKSPITTDLIVAGTTPIGQSAIDGDTVYWAESRPAERGRVVIVAREADGSTADVTPAGFNVRTTVHEYGGGAYLVADGTIYFSNIADQRIYRQTRQSDGWSAPEAITPEGQLRFADYVLDRSRNRLIAVCEDHEHDPTGYDSANFLVAIPLDGVSEIITLTAGYDFYSTPRLSPDGSTLTWLSWVHPDMPWDGTDLWTAPIQDDGTLGESTHIAGSREISIFQPEWSPDGVLHYISDESNWWNLYRWREGQAEALHPMAAEFGGPQWNFGMSLYSFVSAEEIIAAYNERGDWHLASLDTRSLAFTPIATPYTTIGSVRAAGNRVLLTGGSPTLHAEIALLDLTTGARETLRSASTIEVDVGYLSVPQAIEFPTEGGLTAHAFYYPPTNKDVVAPEGERPPLLVMSHGGPTSQTVSVLSLQRQYWTSRGFAVVDVNYGGSTGYGRDYHTRLNGNWGIVDLDDCVNAARYLVREGLADGDRLAITGGSAGGYTTLCALTFRDDFKAGASYFGISDLETVDEAPNKFESRYSRSLVGPYPERADLFKERSPIHFAERLSCPVIFFQGLEDTIVPPAQSERMVEVLREKGIPVAYLAFEGEGHGFRMAANIKRSLDTEFAFYARVFGFTPADEVEPFVIENLA